MFIRFAFVILYQYLPIACLHPINRNNPLGSNIFITTHYTPIIILIIDKLYGHFVVVHHAPIIGGRKALARNPITIFATAVPPPTDVARTTQSPSGGGVSPGTSTRDRYAIDTRWQREQGGLEKKSRRCPRRRKCLRSDLLEINCLKRSMWRVVHKLTFGGNTNNRKVVVLCGGWIL